VLAIPPLHVESYKNSLLRSSKPVLGSVVLLSFSLLCAPVLLEIMAGICEHVRVGQESVQPIREALPVQNGENVRKKIASGEYEVYEEGNEGAVGPFGEEVYDFHESWTLWQTGNREYQVEGDRRFRTSRVLLLSHRFTVDLSRDLAVTRVTEFTTLKWITDSGPVVCEFLLKEMHCSLGGKNPNPARDLHVEATHPYGLLWPISPFSLGSVAKESERDASQATRASLITIEQPSADDPIRPTVLVGDLRYLGVENLEAAGQTWQAYKFSIKVPLHPKGSRSKHTQSGCRSEVTRLFATCTAIQPRLTSASCVVSEPPTT
jgi:hypothetical protein